MALPVMRKDFLLDPYHLAEARAAGADAALLIVAILDGFALGEMLAAASEMGLGVLCEAHSEDEVRRAVEAGARIIGVNQRNLATLEVERGLAARLRAMVPAEHIVVAESGLARRTDLEPLRAAGIDAILVGEALMRSKDPGAALAELLR